MSIAYFLALLTGIVLGLVGSGGSIVTMPILVYVFGISAITATTYSLFIVGTAAFAGTIQNVVKRQVDFRSTLVFSTLSIISVVLTRRFVLHQLPDYIPLFSKWTIHTDTAIMVAFSVLMFGAAYSLISGQNFNSRPGKNLPLLGLSGLLIGIVTALVGAGGGFLIIPSLVLFGGLAMREAIGTSLSIITINSFSGVISDASYLDEIDWIFLLEFSALAVLGIFIGHRLGKMFSSPNLKKIFAGFIVLMATYILIKEILIS